MSRRAVSITCKYIKMPSYAFLRQELPIEVTPELTPQNGECTLGRQKRNSTVRAHERREEIEREFINWTETTTIAKEYGIVERPFAGMRMPSALLPRASETSELHLRRSR
jgi:hypothetical protein